MKFPILITVLIESVLCSGLWQESEVKTNETGGSMSRQGRVFPFYSIGRIANSACTGSNGLSGTCLIRGECLASGGIPSGSCTTQTAQAVCCIFVGTCGGSTSNNVTYFQNSGYPSPYNGGGSCSFTVIPPDNTVCQLRIDFSAFSLSQPDADGACVVDNIQISGASSRVPTICGDNNGQHIYASFSGQSSITIRVAMTATTSFNRLWNLQLSLISCTSAYAAPAGCLQYFLDRTGEVASLNYGSAANPALNGLGMIGTRQIANSNYGICIRSGAGQCSISYTLPTGDPYAFTMTNDVTAVPVAILGTGAVGDQGILCTTDYLIIPNPVGIANDRFCGLGLDPITSNTLPFRLFYITDANDNGDVANRGFRLEYSQNACPVLPMGK